MTNEPIFYENHVAWIQALLGTVGSLIVFGYLLIPFFLDGKRPSTLAMVIGGAALIVFLVVAGFRRQVVIDPSAHEARREMGWFFVRARTVFPLKRFHGIKIEKVGGRGDAPGEPHSERSLSRDSQSYHVNLTGESGLHITSCGTYSEALEEAGVLAKRLGLPLENN